MGKIISGAGNKSHAKGVLQSKDMRKIKLEADHKFEVGNDLINLIKKNSIKSDIIQKPKAHKVTLSRAKKAGVKSIKFMPDMTIGADLMEDYSQTKPEAEIISDEIKKFLTGLAMSSSANEIEIANESGFSQVAGREVIRTLGLDINKDNSKILTGLADVFKRKKVSEFGWGRIIVIRDRIVLSVNRAKIEMPSDQMSEDFQIALKNAMLKVQSEKDPELFKMSH